MISKTKIYCPQCSLGSDLSGSDIVFGVWVCPHCQQSTEMNGIDTVAVDSCRRCGVGMVPGVAIAQTFVGSPDFVGDSHVCTVSPGGPGVLIECNKCPECGHSVTSGIAQ